MSKPTTPDTGNLASTPPQASGPFKTAEQVPAAQSASTEALSQLSGPTIVVRALGTGQVRVPYSLERESIRRDNLIANGLGAVPPAKTDSSR